MTVSKERYIQRFEYNHKLYNDEIARKKNADIRKMVMTDGPEEKRVAITEAWKEYYG